MRKCDCVFEGLYLDGCHNWEEPNSNQLLQKKKIPADNNLQLCDKTEGTVQSEVWPYNIYKALWLNIEFTGYSSTSNECECDNS